MSWSRSVKGTPAEVKATASQWKKEQEANDVGSNDATITGHGKQIDAAVTAVNAIADSASPDHVLEGSVWGHASDSSPGTFGISLKY